MPEIKGGIATLRIDGDVEELRGNLKYGLATVERETVIGQDRVHGYKEIPKPAFLECDLSDRANVDIKRYSDMRDVDLTVELGNGKMFVMQGAWCVTPPELDTAEGQYPVRFEAVEAEEITVSA